MSGESEIDLQSLVADWQAPTAPATPAVQVRDYVRRRGRLIAVWATFEVLLGTGFLVFLANRAVTHPDSIEKVAMGLLAAITAGTMAFGWWNWRGTLRATVENTRTFITLSAERSQRVARAIRAAWVVLAAQVTVFVPWVYYRLYGDGRTPSLRHEMFGWGFLAMMVGVAVVFVLTLHAWARRDAAVFQQIRRELDEE
jgi:hypothetical protein